MLGVWDGVGQGKKQGGEKAWSKHRDQRGQRPSREAITASSRMEGTLEQAGTVCRGQWHPQRPHHA